MIRRVHYNLIISAFLITLQPPPIAIVFHKLRKKSTNHFHIYVTDPYRAIIILTIISLPGQSGDVHTIRPEFWKHNDFLTTDIERSDNLKLNANGTEISVIVNRNNTSDYISLTDIAKRKNPDDPRIVISNWMSSYTTIDFLGNICQ